MLPYLKAPGNVALPQGPRDPASAANEELSWNSSHENKQLYLRNRNQFKMINAHIYNLLLQS
jgi:hypothetical protein